MKVLRGGAWAELPARDVVPGDVLLLSGGAGNSVPCDCVLVSGSVLADESCLTGEAEPVRREAVSAAIFEQLQAGRGSGDVDQKCLMMAERILPSLADLKVMISGSTTISSIIMLIFLLC